jgi:Zn-dependent M16 (insulinase) family peptidase
MENYFLDLANQSNNSYISEQGEIERWVGGIDKEKITKDIIEASEKARKEIKEKLTNEN